jgi:hypothetical protein
VDDGTTHKVLVRLPLAPSIPVEAREENAVVA